MHTMKNRVTLTIDPEIAKRAKKIAHARQTSVSALVEDLVRQTPAPSQKQETTFVEKWSGKFRLRKSAKPDIKLIYLKKRYGIEDE
jgi:mRNA-degrading endonuclease RelE of RelBE toxin-antitoxin system